MARTFEAVSFQCDLPPVLAAQAVDERLRRTHHPDAIDAVLEQTARDGVGSLTRVGRGARVVGVGAGQDREVGERREVEGFPRR